MLHLLRVRQDFVDREFLRSLPDQELLLGEVFGRKYFVRAAGFKQEAATGDSGLRCCYGCGHHWSLQIQILAWRRDTESLSIVSEKTARSALP